MVIASCNFTPAPGPASAHRLSELDKSKFACPQEAWAAATHSWTGMRIVASLSTALRLGKTAALTLWLSYDAYVWSSSVMQISLLLEVGCPWAAWWYKGPLPTVKDAIGVLELAAFKQHLASITFSALLRLQMLSSTGEEGQDWRRRQLAVCLLMFMQLLLLSLYHPLMDNWNFSCKLQGK